MPDKDVFQIIGVMSGSSLDAIDMACVNFTVDGDHGITEWNLVDACAIVLGSEWKNRLSGLTNASPYDLSLTHADLGNFIGRECAQWIAEKKLKPDVIASHGHTIVHHPEKGFTLQIGSPAWIAVMTGCPVISDFRSCDIAAGGHGAPLAPVAEHYLFRGYDYYLNLGGIANLSHFDASGNIRAWDIGAANQLLNHIAGHLGLQYDHGGKIAASGSVDRDLLQKLLSVIPLPLHEAYSLDNTWVKKQFLPLCDESGLSVPDQLSTVVRYIAESVKVQVRSCRDVLHGRKLLVTGGGAHNTLLIDSIRSAVYPCAVELPDEDIIDFKEAILIALCGLLRLQGRPNAFASVTGARYDTVNGTITYGLPRQ